MHPIDEQLNPMEEARRHVIACCDARCEPDLEQLARWTGCTEPEIKQFIVSTLLAYMQQKHLDPILNDAPPTGHEPWYTRPRPRRYRSHVVVAVQQAHADKLEAS